VSFENTSSTQSPEFCEYFNNHNSKSKSVLMVFFA